MIRMSWHIKCFLITIDGLNQPIRLPGLKPGVCSGLILHFDKTQCPEPVEGSGAYYLDLKIGVWRRRTYQ